MSPDKVADLATIEHRMHGSLDKGAEAINYLRWIRDSVAPYVGQDVLDVGAGLGDVTALIRESGRKITAIEPSEELFSELEQRFVHDESVTTIRSDLFDFAPDVPFDSAYMVNVLEHIDDHVGALKYLRTLLAPGASIVIYVPAHEFLYGQFDHDVGHFRRYTKRTLARALVAAGYEINHNSYLNSVGAVGWFTYCRLLGRPPSDDAVVSSYDKLVVPVVRRIESVVSPPFGITVVAVATNPKT